MAIADNFQRDGYVVIDNFFDPEEMKDFERSFSRLPPFETLGELYDAIAFMPAFLRIVSQFRTQRFVNSLLGREKYDPLYCFTSRCLIAPPGDNRRTYGWHQEVFYTIPRSRFIQTWAPLVCDTTVANGTIEVCPGSHKEGIAKQTWTDPPGRAAQIIVEPEIVAKYKPIAVPMTVGQLMFFDSRLFHRSGQNTSSHTRFSLVGMYHAVDAGFNVPIPRIEYRGQSPAEWYASFAQ